MSIIGKSPTLIDYIRRQAPDGKIAKVAEVLARTNEVLEDAVWVEGNLPTGHRTTIRSGLPSVAWRLLNYGVQPTKSTTVQVTDTCGMLEGYSEIDKDLADLNLRAGEFRVTEDAAFLEAMNQEMAQTIFYGDTRLAPEKFLGLSARYSDTTAENGANIVKAGGSGDDNTSIWLVVWDQSTCHMIFPRGSLGGLNHNDLGEVTLEDASGGKYQGYRSHYQWKAGLTLRDWRYVVRIANVDVSDLSSASAADLIDTMVSAYHKVPNIKMGRAAWYCNRTIATFLHKQARDEKNVYLTMDSVGGAPVTSFLEIPVRRCDALLDSEKAVS